MAEQNSARRILPLCYARHRLDNFLYATADCDTVNPSRPPRADDPCFSGDGRRFTGVRSFDNFLEAVRERAAEDIEERIPRQGRRMHLVVAHRGLGKGTFLSAFLTPRGLGEYVQASSCYHDGSSFPKKTVDRFLSAVFINLSFSTEVASTIDMLCGALQDALAGLIFAERHLVRRSNGWGALREIRSAIYTREKGENAGPGGIGDADPRVRKNPRRDWSGSGRYAANALPPDFDPRFS